MAVDAAINKDRIEALKKRVLVPDTGATNCIYQRAGYQRDDISMTIEKGEVCAVSWACPP